MQLLSSVAGHHKHNTTCCPKCDWLPPFNHLSRDGGTTKLQLYAKQMPKVLPKFTNKLHIPVRITSLSEVIVFGTPYKCTISWKNKYAIEAAYSIFLQAIKCAIFENLSTTTNIESQPVFIHSNPSTKSMDRSNKILSGTGNGMYNPIFCACTLPLDKSDTFTQSCAHL